MDLRKIIEDLVDTFLTAGELSLQLREKGLSKEIKSDNTPVSNGDLEVNSFISSEISKVTPDIPIISEETSENKDNYKLKDFWLVDPIDGTYDYINNLEEFTINAGLIINNKPVAGLINAPAKKRMFYSYGKGKSFEFTNNERINLSELPSKRSKPLNFISYSNKIKPEIVHLISMRPIIIGILSALFTKSKFCATFTGMGFLFIKKNYKIFFFRKIIIIYLKVF